MPRPKKKDGIRVDLLLDKSLLEQMDKYCELTGATRTKLIELSVNKYLKDYFKKHDNEN